MSKNLTELTELSNTSVSDLIHVNNGGVDYKQTKRNFIRSLGSGNIVTSPDDAIDYGTVYGINGSADMPTTGYYSIICIPYSSSGNNCAQIAFLVNTQDPRVYIRTSNMSGAWGSWRSFYSQQSPTYTLGTNVSGSMSIVRSGEIIIANATLQLSAGTWTSSNVIAAVSPVPVADNRMVWTLGSVGEIDMRLTTNGEIIVNSSNGFTLTANKYLLGQVVYISR